MKLSKTLLLFSFAALSLVANAQEVDKALVTTNADAAKTAVDDLKKVDTGEKAWKFDGVVGLNAAATGLVNWAAGGKNNVNGVAYAKLHLLYHKNAIAWESNFDTDFGMTWIDQNEDKLQKSSDNIKFATKFGWEFHKDWYLTVLGGFQSQYAFGRDYVAGYNPIISKWLAPSYTDISVGIDWKRSVNGADFSVYLSPIAGRITTAFISDKMNTKMNQDYIDGVTALGETPDPSYDYATLLKDKYGVSYYDDNSQLQHDRSMRAEFGLSLKGAVAYKYDALTLSSTVALFTPYAGKGYELAAGTDNYFKYSNKGRQFGHFDVDWDVAVSYQFFKVLNVTLSTSLKYYPGTLIANSDGVEAERVQFKSVLGIGIGYSF